MSSHAYELSAKGCLYKLLKRLQFWALINIKEEYRQTWQDLAYVQQNNLSVKLGLMLFKRHISDENS
jgi:hypothetical protein